LAEAIEGVLIQKCDFEIELIIAEDCSQDKTREIAIDYQKKYPHLIRVLHSEGNVGVHENSRRAFIECRGKYTALCEGDDYWTDNLKLKDQVAIIEQSDDIAAVHADHVFRQDFWGGKFITSFNGRYSSRENNELAGDLRHLMAKDLITHTSTVLLKTELIHKYINSKYGSLNGSMYDCCMMTWLTLNGVIAYLNRPVSVYRVWFGSLMRSGFSGALKMKTEQIYFFKELFADNPDLKNLYLSWDDEVTYNLINLAFKSGDKNLFKKIIKNINYKNLSTNKRIAIISLKYIHQVEPARLITKSFFIYLKHGREIISKIKIFVGIEERVSI
jgi:glycosyltransferase involved in cell wall biosynthesis